MSRIDSPTCLGCGSSVPPHIKKCNDCLTSERRYYILEVDTLVDSQDYDDPTSPGLKAYSIIIVDKNGAHEIDRAYRNVVEALEAWPEAVPPRN